MPSKDVGRQLSVIRKALAELPGLMTAGVRKAFRVWGGSWLREFTKTNLSGQHGRFGLARRTGSLARSFNYKVIQTGGRTTLRVWVSSGYAAIHEFGGDITPTGGRQFLTIPNPYESEMWTNAGVLRQEFVGRGKQFYESLGLSIMKKGEGDPFLGKVDAGGEVRAYFLLRRRVEIPARMGFEKTFVGQAKTVIPVLKQTADQALATKYKRI